MHEGLELSVVDLAVVVFVGGLDDVFPELGLGAGDLLLDDGFELFDRDLAAAVLRDRSLSCLVEKTESLFQLPFALRELLAHRRGQELCPCCSSLAYRCTR